MRKAKFSAFLCIPVAAILACAALIVFTFITVDELGLWQCLMIVPAVIPKWNQMRGKRRTCWKISAALNSRWKMTGLRFISAKKQTAYVS